MIRFNRHSLLGSINAHCTFYSSPVSSRPIRSFPASHLRILKVWKDLISGIHAYHTTISEINGFTHRMTCKFSIPHRRHKGPGHITGIRWWFYMTNWIPWIWTNNTFCRVDNYSPGPISIETTIALLFFLFMTLLRQKREQDKVSNPVRYMGALTSDFRGLQQYIDLCTICPRLSCSVRGIL